MEANTSFLCSKCPKTFPHKRNPVRHVRSVHVQNGFVCDSCGNYSSREELLKRHKLSSSNLNYTNSAIIAVLLFCCSLYMVLYSKSVRSASFAPFMSWRDSIQFYPLLLHSQNIDTLLHSLSVCLSAHWTSQGSKIDKE